MHSLLFIFHVLSTLISLKLMKVKVNIWFSMGVDHSNPYITYILCDIATCSMPSTCIFALLDATTLAEASFNDTRCEENRGVVCPTDPLLFTCNVTATPSDRVFLTFFFTETVIIRLTNSNVIQGSEPDGISILSHNVTGPSPYDYILTLSLASASLLNGGMIECDSGAGMREKAGCPVAGELCVGSQLDVLFL